MSCCTVKIECSRYFFFEKECENVAKIPMDTTFCLFFNISEIVCTLLGWLLQENRKRGEVVYFLSFFFFLNSDCF